MTDSELSRLLRDVAATPAQAPAIAGRTIGAGGRYRLLERIGRGGMGEVWKARDDKLARDVAVKLLASDALDDPDRRARFLREARAAAALSHPNVCAVFDVDEHDDVPFIAMELLAGSSLRELLANTQGALAPESARAIALDIASGLAAAHAAGIVHRDVKPENVRVLPDGRAKLVDFGLARVLANEDAGASHTATGVVLGTARYMSPEQAEGKPLDARTDVFSFGIVLFEMISGAWPWDVSSSAGVVAAILRDPPRPFAIPRDPQALALGEIAARCLEKDPARRYPNAGEIARAIGALASGVAHAPRRALRTSSVPRWIAIGLAFALTLGLVAVAVFVAYGARYGRPDPPPAPTVRERVTDEAGVDGAPSLSRDGTLLAYVAEHGRARLVVRDLAAKRMLFEWTPPGAPPTGDGASNASIPRVRFSPDGKRLAFGLLQRPFGIYVMDIADEGHTPRHVIDGGSEPSWSADGRELVYAAGALDVGAFTLEAVDIETGARRTVFNAHQAWLPAVSPNGTCVAFSGGPNLRAYDVMLVPFSGAATATAVTHDGRSWAPAWSSDGTRLYWLVGSRGVGSIGDVLWSAPVDEAACTRTGDARAVFSSAATMSDFALAGNSLVYASTTTTSELVRASLTDGEAPKPITTLASDLLDLHVSPDGQWLTYGDWQHIWRMRTDGTDRRVVTDDEWAAASVFAPDSKRIAYVKQTPGDLVTNIWLTDVDGAAPRRLTSSRVALNRAVWSPDGTRLVAGSFDGLWAFDVGAGPVEPKRVGAIGQGRRAQAITWSARGLLVRIRGGVPYGDELQVVTLANDAKVIGRTVGTEQVSGVRGVAGGAIVAYDAEGRLLRCEADLADTTADADEALDLDACDVIDPAPPGWGYNTADLAPDGDTVWAVRRMIDGDLWRIDLP